MPQAKGRVERLNQTLQSRLPVELRLAGITDISSANEFLYSYIKEFNKKFSLPLNGIRSVFVEFDESSHKKSPPKDRGNVRLSAGIYVFEINDAAGRDQEDDCPFID